MFTCYQCGKLIRAKMRRANLRAHSFHPECYDKAEREAARILKQKAADWQEKTCEYRISIGLETRQESARNYRIATDEHVERLRMVERIRGDVMSIFEKMDAERV